MSWTVHNSITWFQKLAINIIKTGHIPKHVAFIMDGNRRFAKKNNIPKVEGHTKGFDKLIEIWYWCQKLGIQEITVYAFSLDNFKRTQEEVDSIMELFKQKFVKLLEDRDEIMEHGICFRVIGNLSYLLPELKELIAKITLLTENNTNLFFNIALAYSSRDEITNSIKCIIEGVNIGLLEAEDINEQLISDCLYTNKSEDPDLLIRTSGVVRFSDFLLWQISTTQVCFIDALWPELSFWQVLLIFLKYQTNYHVMQFVKQTKTLFRKQYTQNNTRVVKFLEHLNECRRNELLSYLR